MAVYIQLQNIIIVLSFKKEKVQYCIGLENDQLVTVTELGQ